MSAAAASGTTPVVHAVHENPEWFGVFAEAFEADATGVVGEKVKETLQAEADEAAF